MTNRRPDGFRRLHDEAAGVSATKGNRTLKGPAHAAHTDPTVQRRALAGDPFPPSAGRMLMMTAALILTGSPGSGKSSVLAALSTLFEIDATAFAAVESEELARGWPWLTLADALPALAAVTAFQRAAGRDLFLVVATAETSAELQSVIDALAVDRVLVVCLHASPEAVAGRIADREPDAWPGKQPLIAHARELAMAIPTIAGIDAVVETDGRSAVEVAAEVRALLSEHEVISALDA